MGFVIRIESVTGALNLALVTCYRRWDNQPPTKYELMMESLPKKLVAEFLNEYRASGVYLRDRVARIAELAASENDQVAESASKAVFTGLAEHLADSFEGEAVTLYNRVFAQLIQPCREKPSGESLDRALLALGIRSEEELIARAEKLRHISRLTLPPERAANLKRVIILSRVTLGADVAITSVIVERMKQTFASAGIVIVGGQKASELFGGDPRVRFKEVDYRRAGTTIARLVVWADIVEIIRELSRDLQPDEYLILDPDTRLTQLGLLPLTVAEESPASHGYIFFPSREYGGNTSQSLAELTSAWLDQVFGQGDKTYPTVSLNHKDLEAARSLVSRVRAAQKRPIVAINFGIGDNPLKRVGGDFESSLVSGLIREGARVILDKGAGETETRRADALVAEATRIERKGHPVRAIEIDEGKLTSEDLDADILVWNGRIGMLAALIGESDVYIGYDSAGGHIAAALGVPCIDLFAGFSSDRFVDRWRPTGKAETRILKVEPPNGGIELAKRVIQQAVEMLRRNELKIEN